MVYLAVALAAETPGIGLPDPIWTLRLWEADSGAIVTAARPAGLHVWRVADSGKITWELDVPCDDPAPKVGTIPAFAVLGATFACAKKNEVLGFSMDTGARSWSWSGDSAVTSLAASLGEDPRFVVATAKTVSLLTPDKGHGSAQTPIPKDTPALSAVGGRVAVFAAATRPSRWASVPLFDSKSERKKSGVVPWQLAEQLGAPELSDGVLRGVIGPDVVKVDLADGKVLTRQPRDLVGSEVPGERGVIVPAPGTIALLDPRTGLARWSAPAKASVLIHEHSGRLIAASDSGFEAWSTDGAALGSGAWTGVVTDVVSSPAAVFALLEVLNPRGALKGAGNAHHPEAPRPATPSRSSLVVLPLGNLGAPATPPKSAAWVEGTRLTWQLDGKIQGTLVRVLGDPEWTLYQDDALIRARVEDLAPLVEPPAGSGQITWVPGWEVPALVTGDPGAATWVLQYPDHPTVLLRESDGQRAWLVSVDIP